MSPLDVLPTAVVLGETEDEALLGAVTLETLGLMLNPLNRTLQPMRMVLARAKRRRRRQACWTGAPAGVLKASGGSSLESRTQEYE